MKHITKNIVVRSKSIVITIIAKCFSIYFKTYRWPLLQKEQARQAGILAKKNKIRIGFLVIHHSIWKVDEVFKKLCNDELFEPVIIVCPDVKLSPDKLFEHLNHTIKYYRMKDYTVFSTFDSSRNKWLNLSQFQLDAIWFTNPHEITKKEYHIDLLYKYLCFYVPYYFMATDHQGDKKIVYDNHFFNCMYRIFWPSEYHLWQRQIYKSVGNKNDIVTGYPAVEKILSEPATQNPWKPQISHKLKIIYAPHHSIEDGPNSLSNFLDLGLFIQNLAKKYHTKIQWCFKPHPLLRRKLESNRHWGPDKTEQYYSFWSEQSYTQTELGDYYSLFQTADAIIHDSSSFIAEFALTGKPGILNFQRDELTNIVNDFGMQFISNYLITTDPLKIENFLNLLLDNVTGSTKQQPPLDYISKYHRNTVPSDLIIRHLKDCFGH